MNSDLTPPTSLIEAVVFYSDEQRAFETVRDRRWPNGVVCPHCGGSKVRYMEIHRETKRKHTDKVRRVWQCACRKQFTVKTGTIFEDSPLTLSLWLPAMWMLANCKNGISSWELSRALKVQQRTAWFMLGRLRTAMLDEDNGKLVDDVEVDETYIGGKARNMHKNVREAKIHGRGAVNKTIVFGMLERGGEIKAQVIQSNDRETLHYHIKHSVLAGCNLYSDAWRAYDGLSTWYQHKVIDHAVSYVDGMVHTNSIENFWSLLKRSLKGTYVSVEPFHLHRYLSEQAFRYNARKDDDLGRFLAVLSQVTGRRLTYAKLTGKELVQA